jgi:hypothetical protein
MQQGRASAWHQPPSYRRPICTAVTLRLGSYRLSM